MADFDPNDPKNRALLDSIRTDFTRYGLDALWEKVYALIVDGYDKAETILPLLKNEQAYKDRFKANAARTAKGLRELTPGEYVNLEEQYRGILGSAGLPQGMYDTNDDLTGYLSNDLSPYEMQARINAARDATVAADPNVKRTLKEWYGVDDTGVLGYFLDPAKGAQFLEQQWQAAKFAGTAATNNLSGIDRAFTDEFTKQNADWSKLDMGSLTQDAANADRLAGVWQSDRVSTADLVRDQLGTDQAGQARDKKRKLASAERAAFSGSTGTGSKSLARKTGGQL